MQQVLKKTVVIIALAILFIGGLVFGGWKYWEGKNINMNAKIYQDDLVSIDSMSHDRYLEAKIQSIDMNDWLTYRDEILQIEFKYPKDWEISKLQNTNTCSFEIKKENIYLQLKCIDIQSGHLNVKTQEFLTVMESYDAVTENQIVEVDKNFFVWFSAIAGMDSGTAIFGVRNNNIFEILLYPGDKSDMPLESFQIMKSIQSF